MDKEFDFDDIGKKTPYRTPDNFFEDMQQKVMERTYGGQRRKHRLPHGAPCPSPLLSHWQDF